MASDFSGSGLLRTKYQEPPVILRVQISRTFANAKDAIDWLEGIQAGVPVRGTDENPVVFGTAHICPRGETPHGE